MAIFTVKIVNQAFSREKKRAVLENQDAFHAQAEAMADRLRKQASASLQQVWAGGTLTDALTNLSYLEYCHTRLYLVRNRNLTRKTFDVPLFPILRTVFFNHQVAWGNLIFDIRLSAL